MTLSFFVRPLAEAGGTVIARLANVDQHAAWLSLLAASRRRPRNQMNTRRYNVVLRRASNSFMAGVIILVFLWIAASGRESLPSSILTTARA